MGGRWWAFFGDRKGGLWFASIINIRGNAGIK
jgi:hypothetical protein